MFLELGIVTLETTWFKVMGSFSTLTLGIFWGISKQNSTLKEVSLILTVERTPFVFTTENAYVMGGEKSKDFARF
jgi:hypothetical protein